ncbi:hypothetical protein E2C01_093807 [Portunus trituberculatus]|uniref:Uncharacterized protein n=1 Tax=Portunus trituberculatus TaxID=210409 RepID=A0A5B7JVU7_PORTR|nr:hypothetical protein [Portunus trituberculatus]
MCITLKKNWINGDMETGHYEPLSNPAKLDHNRYGDRTAQA